MNKQDMGGRDTIVSGQQVTIGGSVSGSTIQTAGRDITVTAGATVDDLAQQFAAIYRQIDARPEDPNVDKEELKDTVQKIEQEAKKAEQANPNKVERWLRFLAEMADDIFQVTAATLANPAAGVVKAIQLVAKKAKEDKAGAH